MGLTFALVMKTSAYGCDRLPGDRHHLGNDGHAEIGTAVSPGSRGERHPVGEFLMPMVLALDAVITGGELAGTRGRYQVPVSGRSSAASRAASDAGTPSSRKRASASWSTATWSIRSGSRRCTRSSPSSPPATALSAISASGTMNRPVACPAWMSRRARSARPTGVSSASRATPVRKSAMSAWVQPRRPRRADCRCRLCHYRSSCRRAGRISGHVSCS